MNWYYSIQGGHTHVRVFMNGGKCGDLCFRNEEFEAIKEKVERVQNIAEAWNPWRDGPLITFIEEQAR